MERLTNSDPKNSEMPNFHTLMNFCTSKNGRAVLCYADGVENVDLAEYTACKCHVRGKDCGCEMCSDMTSEEIADGALMELECDCENAVMYFCGLQAASNNYRLKAYEDTGVSPEEIQEMLKRKD